MPKFTLQENQASTGKYQHYDLIYNDKDGYGEFINDRRNRNLLADVKKINYYIALSSEGMRLTEQKRRHLGNQNGVGNLWEFKKGSVRFYFIEVTSEDELPYYIIFHWNKKTRQQTDLENSIRPFAKTLNKFIEENGKIPEHTESKEEEE